MSRSTLRRLGVGAALAALGAIAATVFTVGAGAAGSATTTTTSTTSSTTTTAAPKNTDPPTLDGTPTEGSTLTATDGTWTGAKLKFIYRFLRCDTNGGSCFKGGSTTQKTYKLTARDVGNTIRVRVTATNSGGTASATSAPTAVIKKASAPPPTASNGCPSGTGTIQIAQLTSPARLTVDRQAVSPPVIGRSTNQLQVRFHVSACNGRDVQGALVYVTAVPFQQFSIPPETATTSDGWASMTMGQLGGFPAANSQQLLVLFVRARKPGENLLGGISTRRLISFRVNLSH
jgi:hypothetical protein